MILANDYFENIFEEYHSSNKDKFDFIQSYTSLLLLLTKRYFNERDISEQASHLNRTADIGLLSRFQTMVETWIADEDAGAEIRQTSFYANKLNVHTNHLNAVVKRITGQTASTIIQNGIIVSAKSLLRQTHLSVKEVAFKLHFTEPAHFNSFFKKLTGFTPKQFRENHIL